MSHSLTIRAAGIGDAAVVADLVRRAFAKQSQPTNPPSGALKETAATIAEQLINGGGAVLEGALFLGRLASIPSIADAALPEPSSTRPSAKPDDVASPA